MKNLLLFVLIFFLSFLLIPCGVKGETPSIQLIVKWETPRDTLFLKNLRKDPDICCVFSFITQKSDSFITEVKTVDGISVGIIYGMIDSRFLHKITPNLEEIHSDLRGIKIGSFGINSSFMTQSELKSIK